MSAAGYVLQEAWCLGPVLEGCNLIDLWRLKGVSRAFKGKCAEALWGLGSLLVCGGLDPFAPDEVALWSVHLLSLDSMRWREGPSLPQGLFDHACVAQSDGTVLCIGGSSGGGRWRIRPVSGRLSTTEDEDEEFSKSVFALEPGAEEWVQRSLLHSSRCSFAAKACEDGTVLMLGGFREDSEDPTARVDRLDPATGVVTPPPCGMWFVGCAWEADGLHHRPDRSSVRHVYGGLHTAPGHSLCTSRSSVRRVYGGLHTAPGHSLCTCCFCRGRAARRSLRCSRWVLRIR
jgi:hypothetical protein